MDQALQEFVLINASGSSVSILNLGLILHSCIIQMKDGSERETILGLTDKEDYLLDEYLENYPYMGAIVGRYANRISNAAFPLEDKIYHLNHNNGLHCLHGGLVGFDRKFWDMKWLEEGRSIHATYLSADGEEGFPGNLTCNAIISWSDEHTLSLQLEAVTDAATPVNLTWHPYFNLDAVHSKIENHGLQLFCDKFLIQHPDLTPTGGIKSVLNTPLNFQSLNALDGAIEIGGIDSSFIVSDFDGTRKHVATLMSSDRSLSLEAWTNVPIVHLYTGGNMPEIQIQQKAFFPFQGVCLECQFYTDALNHPQFPSTVLQPGDTYRQTIQYTFVNT